VLDKLVLHLFVKSKYVDFYDLHTDKPIPYFDLNKLPAEIPTVGDIYKTEENGVILKTLENEKTKYESLASSHSGMAFKFFHNGRNCDPYVELKCSPAKLLQGHNLYGFDDIQLAAQNMIALLSVAYPVFYKMLNLTNIQVSEIDINYSVFIADPQAKKMFMDHLRYVSNGQTKSRDSNYSTTSYFGAKNSRIKKLKVYSKIEEMENDAVKMEKQGFLESAKIIREEALTDRAKQAVRFEATIKKRFLQKRGIPTDLIGLCRYMREKDEAYKLLFNEAWKDIFKALEGHTMKLVDNDSVYNAIKSEFQTVTKTGRVSLVKVNRLFSFYQTLKTFGYDHASTLSTRVMFYYNVTDLIKCGFSKSFLQNLHKDSGAVVIQMSKYITIDFDNQVPDGYQIPKNLDFEGYGRIVSIC